MYSVSRVASDGNDVAGVSKVPSSIPNLFLFASLLFFSLSFLFSYCSFVLFLYTALNFLDL